MSTLVEAISEPGLYEMTNAEYHAQPALSASGMRLLLEAPAKYKYAQTHAAYSDHFDFGTIWHKEVLADESTDVVVVQKLTAKKELVDAEDYKTVSAREHRDQIRAEGKTPALAADLKKARAMVAALRENEEAARLLDLDNGAVEQSAFWQDERTGVWLRARFDYLPNAVDGKPFEIADPKSAHSSNPEKWIKSAPDYGYHVQRALYERAAVALGIHPRPEFVFVVQEKEPPYLVTPIRLDAHARAIGDHLIDKAIDRFVECQTTDKWGGYVDGTYVASLPGYYSNQFEGLI